MIRFGNSSDIEKITNIYEDAKKLFSDLGYFQWKGNYPNIDNAINDINNNKVLVIEIDNDIVCTLSLCFSVDHNYDVIDGSWLNDNQYVSIHRNCTNHKYYHKGYMTKLFMEAEKVIKDNNIYDIKIDTHMKNIYMQKMLEKLGYKKCGIIKLLNRPDLEDDLRIAYQKHLD